MVKKSDYYHEKGLAIRGYDTVAFFKLNKAIKGEKKHTCLWRGLEWRFVSEWHLELFKSNPEKYLPAYGGFCAFGASEGYKAATKPTAFTMQNGRLYLNFAHYVKKRWVENSEDKIRKADARWVDTRATTPIKAHPFLIWWKYQFLKLLGKDLFE